MERRNAYGTRSDRRHVRMNFSIVSSFFAFLHPIHSWSEVRISRYIDLYRDIQDSAYTGWCVAVRGRNEICEILWFKISRRSKIKKLRWKTRSWESRIWKFARYTWICLNRRIKLKHVSEELSNIIFPKNEIPREQTLFSTCFRV